MMLPQSPSPAPVVVAALASSTIFSLTTTTTATTTQRVYSPDLRPVLHPPTLGAAAASVADVTVEREREKGHAFSDNMGRRHDDCKLDFGSHTLDSRQLIRHLPLSSRVVFVCLFVCLSVRLHV